MSSDDDLIKKFYSTDRHNYEGALNEELRKRFDEIDRKFVLYYVINDLRKMFPNGIGSLLDIGGGIGATILALRKYIYIKEAYSIDLFEPSFKSYWPIFVRGSAYELSKIFPNKKFDVITMFDVIEHLFSPDRAIEEIKKVLSDNGVLLITTPNLSSLINRLLLLLGYQPIGTEVSSKKQYGKIKGNKSVGVAGHIRVFTYRALIEFLEDNGFEILKSYTVPFNWPLNFPYNLLDFVERLAIKINKRLGQRIIVFAKIK